MPSETTDAGAPADISELPALAAPPPVPETVPEAVGYWLEIYSRNPSEATRSLRDLAAKAPELTAETLLRRYDAGTCGEAINLVAGMLAGSSRAVERLCDPSAPLEASLGLAQALAKQEPRFDAHFARNLIAEDRVTEQALQRGLTILENLGSCGRLIPILIQLLRNPNSRVRSRAALTMGRFIPTQNLVFRLMRDEDDRVRANFVEGLWSSGSNHCELFRQALRDPHPRVVGNALIGLHRAGQSRDVIQNVAQMARNVDARFRATAAWVMGQTGEERYTAVLRHMLHDQGPGVRRNALISLRRIRAAQAAPAA